MTEEKYLPPLTFVLGGANSGKSKVAESLVTNCDLARTYIATAQAWDDEMRRKIADHKIQRGPDWTTVEAPIDLPQTLANVDEGVILIDCATMWLTNLILADREIDSDVRALLIALDTCRVPVVLVSNEVGQGIVPDNQMARDFVKIQGRFNQQLAAQADRVLFVTAGLTQVLK